MVTLLPVGGTASAETAANNELVHRITFEIGIQETFIGDVPA